jgi:23S rRNA A2030 N6-methylase RlmJ
MATSTSVQTSLSDVPAVLKPYMTDAGGILPAAQKLLAQPYSQTYGDPLTAAGLAGSGRVAGLAPMQQQIGAELGGMGTPGQFGTGTSAAQLGLGALGGMTNAAQTQAFMSPYMQNVMDVNKAEALRDAQKQLVGANLASSRQGSYGGARNALMQSEAERNLQTKLGGIQATGMQSAFEDARKSQLAQASGYNQLGATLGQLGTAEQAADIDRIKTQGAYGDLQRATQQQQLDAQYQDLMRQLDYPMEQIGTMSNLLRGVPIQQTATSTTNTTPAPSFASQLAGSGLTGLSLYNMFNK